MRSLLPSLGAFLTVLIIASACGSEDEGPTDVGPDPLSVTTTSLAAGEIGAAYSATLMATGGSDGYAWTVATGSLPDGLSLATGGAVTGTPTSIGTEDFTVQVASGDGQTASQALSITVSAGACILAGCAGLQGWWKLDESPLSNGSTTADASGLGRTGTLVTDNGTDDKSTAGQVDGGLGFDGAVDHVTVVDDNTGLDLGDDFTLMTWVNANVLPASTWQALISKNTSPRPASLWLWADSVQVWYTVAGVGGERAHSAGAITVGAWHHVAATFDASAGEIRIYIDGALDSTTTGVAGPADTTDDPLVLGQRGDSQFYLDGVMDEAMVWSRMLSDAEIQAIYDATK